MTRIEAIFTEAIEAHRATLQQSASVIREAADRMRRTIEADGKILTFGNGGSAADAQHVAAEFINRFQRERKPLAAIALTTDTSVITSIANDSDYDRVFSRQIEALGRRGDIALGISTSGRSASVLAAFRQARSQGLTTVALVGPDGSAVHDHVDLFISAVASSTPRIQEVHRTILHVLCELVEA